MCVSVTTFLCCCGLFVAFSFGIRYPTAVPELAAVVREYMEKLTHLGHSIMRGLALALGLSPSFFKTAMTADPFTPFRIFNYPAPVRKKRIAPCWQSVGNRRKFGPHNRHCGALPFFWCRLLDNIALAGGLESTRTTGC